MKTNELIYQLKIMIDALPGDIYWKDIDGIWLGMNQQCADSLKRMGFIATAHESHVLGKTDYEIFDKATADEYRKNDDEVMRNRKEIIREEATKLPNGDVITLLSTKKPFLDKNNNLIGIIGNSIDISDRKKMEFELSLAKKQSEAANQAKTEFLENMRHDIRTPLTGIVGFADLIGMEADNPLIKDYSQDLIASSHALLALLDEVLEAIQVGSGEIPKLKKKFSLKNCLSHVVELNKARAAQKKILLSFFIDEAFPDYVIGDKVRLHRIALELVANAINFTESGSVKLSAILAKRDETKMVLTLTVEDTGIGILKEKQQEIYVQFKRLSPSYEGIYKGYGLGLAVVKQFIDDLNGEIYVKSEPNKGTVFTCIIPLKEPLLDDSLGLDEEYNYVREKSNERLIKQIKPISDIAQEQLFYVLIVEDNSIAQTVAKSILLQLGCNVDIADSGKKALDLWKKGSYDLILMDIGLPDFSGYEVSHQIRLFELNNKSRIPIIALTAHTGDENKKKCIEMGMNTVLIKPLTTKSCREILEAFIPGYSQQIQNKSREKKFTSELPEKHEVLFQLSNYPILDIEEGIKTIGNKSLLVEMLNFLIHESLPKDLEEMIKFYQGGDWENTQKLAHKIKGGAVYLGTIKIKMACQYFERYWKSGQRDLLEPLYQQVISVINESLVEINEWLEAH